MNRTLSLCGLVSLASLTCLAIITPAASASITSVAGQTTLLGSPPVSCVYGALNGFNAYAWDEKTNVLSTGAYMDMINNPANNGTAIPGTISGQFDSHFLHFENVPGVISAQGSVTFSSQIIGVAFFANSLDNTDATFGSPGTIYPTTYAFRGLNAASVFAINNNILTFNFAAFTPTQDVVQLRVLTHSVPTPAAASLLGLSGLIAAGRRRR